MREKLRVERSEGLRGSRVQMEGRGEEKKICGAAAAVMVTEEHFKWNAKGEVEWILAPSSPTPECKPSLNAAAQIVFAKHRRAEVECMHAVNEPTEGEMYSYIGGG